MGILNSMERPHLDFKASFYIHIDFGCNKLEFFLSIILMFLGCFASENESENFSVIHALHSGYIAGGRKVQIKDIIYKFL